MEDKQQNPFAGVDVSLTEDGKRVASLATLTFSTNTCVDTGTIEMDGSFFVSHSHGCSDKYTKQGSFIGKELRLFSVLMNKDGSLEVMISKEIKIYDGDSKGHYLFKARMSE